MTNGFSLDTLIHDDELMIRSAVGNTCTLVLAFTGVKHGMGGLPMAEFAGSAATAGARGFRHHVLFISDMRRSWFSRRELSARIVAIIREFVSSHGIVSIDAVGNSMGGYGAFLFADFLKIRTSLAFSPQISMHPERINEKRWKHFRSSFGPELRISLKEVISRASKTRFFAIFGDESSPDLLQAALLPVAENLTVWALKGCGHDAAAFLKSRGCIRSTVGGIFSGDYSQIDDLFLAVGARNLSASRGRSV